MGETQRDRMSNAIRGRQSGVAKSRVGDREIYPVFGEIFEQELRARNRIHHHSRFEDVAIDRVFLTALMSQGREDKGWQHEHMVAYRKVVREWAQRVRQRGLKMDEFLEAVAGATLSTCIFLTPEQPLQ